MEDSDFVYPYFSADKKQKPFVKPAYAYEDFKLDEKPIAEEPEEVKSEVPKPTPKPSAKKPAKIGPAKAKTLQDAVKNVNRYTSYN